ncbi:RapZ C-terminal domain-containing protein [Ferruginibacter albus]|uniref:RapZ C-terminal domain-containing protein n=1 Tax=Ferruginibacter albus TaxID=2875540 RepID=UPI001CC6228B|nr:RNase adapter RapZ [Ferruginibacter albus]UAY52204.1 phosphotransferase [Ferruginibacter albus]
MQIIEEIKKLFQSYSSAAIVDIYKIPQSGSDREYFRIKTSVSNYIATYSNNIKENETFLYFSKHFTNAGAPVPEIYAISNEKTIYIQQDFGDVSLLNVLEDKGQSPEVYALFEKSLKALSLLQINGDKNLDYSKCITSKEFGKQAIISDLLYFKYYFLDTLKIPYDKEKLIDDFDALATYLSYADHKYFMFRDFQSRNIMVQNDEAYFIDFQGGMKGALQYDVASLLWQAKAELSDEWKNKLLQYYMNCVEEVLQTKIDKTRFESQYNGYVLIRLLQVLGAYGFRGLFERKAHFLISIPLALRNLKWFINNKHVGIALPEFERLLGLIVEEKLINHFETIKATDETPLIVHINSFSYKNGIPVDTSQNGGGFVFDCRGILNPGRIEAYKKQSGLDKEVKDYLEQETDMPAFLNSIYDLVDISVTDYIKRNFNSLQINFGCTGGQHRSVYASEALARHLKNKFKVKVILNHMNQINWKR